MPKYGWGSKPIQPVEVVNEVTITPTQEVTVLPTVTEALTISAHDLNAAQYSQATSLTADSIVDSLILYFSANGSGIYIILEDSDTGAQLLYHQLVNARASFAAFNINYALTSARSVQLTVGQTAGACTLNGALFVRG